MHDRPNAYPDFMPTWSTTQAPNEVYPENYEAAAALAVEVLKYGYTDFTRPVTYELVNEPHWSVWNDQRFADWHVATRDRAIAEAAGVDIGGPCLSVAYFYRNNYSYLRTLTNFIDNTGAALDFYSFHAYDFVQWNEDKGDFAGRVTSGLPMEGILDAIQNYTVNTHGRVVPIVLTEHGGYLFRDPGNFIPESLATTLLGPGDDFAWELRRRSVGHHIMVSGAIGNTLAFLNHPHTCLLYTSPSPRDQRGSRMPSSA